MPSINSYGTLATAVQAYLSRNDVGVASGNLDYLIYEAEAELNSRLRVRRMLTAVTPTVSSTGVVTMPSFFGGWKRFQARDGTNEWDLDLLAPELTTEVSSLYASSTGRPRALIQGDSARIWPFTNGAYTYAALYYARIESLTVANPSNWLVLAFPMAYLYGCLAAARGFSKNDTPRGASRFDLWQKRFEDAIRQIQREDRLDHDARNSAVLNPDTSLFSGRSAYNVISDSY